LLAAKQDPVGLVREHDYLIVDEVQRAPELILAIKKAVDDDRRPGRFLLTGSANLMTLPTVADSLAGRMETLQLLPLSQSEIHGGKANWIDSVFADSVPKVNHSFEHWRTLLATLIDLTPENARERRDRFGPVLETFVYGELLKHASSAEGDYELLYYRDHDKMEVDFVIENAAGDIVGVEVKSTATVKADSLRGLHRFSDAAGPRFKRGIVLYDGTETLPLGDGIHAVPLSSLWGD
jgi:predicted AAA+ superfamily ATPase